MTDKPYCILPWYHQLVQSSGKMLPCCSWAGPPIDSNYGDFFHSQFMQDLRLDMLSGNIPDECRHCVYAETQTGESHRTHGWILATDAEVDWRDAPTLRRQEVNLINVCNLRCRSCDSSRSTKWAADEIAMKLTPHALESVDWRLSPDQVTSIKQLDFLGGEPLLHQEQICDELEKMKNARSIDQLILHFTTNGTIYFSDRMLDLLRYCRYTWVNVSIDGYGILNEYIRSDSDWHEIDKNLRRLDQLAQQLCNFGFGVNHCYSVLNANAAYPLLQYLADFKTDIKLGITMVNGPNQYDARNLPNDAKIWITDRYMALLDNIPNYRHALESMISHLKEPATMQHDAWVKKFTTFNNFLDTRRHAALLDANKELYDMLDIW